MDTNTTVVELLFTITVKQAVIGLCLLASVVIGYRNRGN